MAKRSLIIVFLVLLGSIIFISDAYPEPTFDYGAAFRLRQEIWDNLVDLKTLNKPDRNFYRARTLVWGKADFSKDLGAYLKVGNEAKYYTGPYRPNTPFNEDRLDEDEAYVDNLYLDVKNVFGLPVDLRIGRQDFLFIYGEGLLLMDGTPGDGSRSFYFNAAKAVWRINPSHSVDLIFLSDPKTDIYLPSLYPAHHGALYVDHKRLLNISDERAFVAWGRNKITDNLSLEPFYIYKREETFDTVPKLTINTIGARAVYAIDEWKLRGKFAHQFGEYEGGRDRRGYGGYVIIGRKYKDVTLKPEFDLGYVYLSGDKDPQDAQGTHDGWDPLFSRCPSWNELYIYTQVYETIKDSGPLPGYWTNLHWFIALFKMHFTQSTNLTLTYQYLKAVEKTYGLNPAMFSNSGKERGHLPTAFLYHKFSKHVDAFLQFEYLIPGNFYVDSAKNGTFIRVQLQIKI